jgi:hypothetical protein
MAVGAFYCRSIHSARVTGRSSIGGDSSINALLHDCATVGELIANHAGPGDFSCFAPHRTAASSVLCPTDPT